VFIVVLPGVVVVFAGGVALVGRVVFVVESCSWVVFVVAGVVAAGQR
jgi:hypothetical protein